jgi:hypothetical protein
MTAVAFPSEAALVAAITAELVSPEELAAPVRHWRDGDVVWVRPDAELTDETLARLVERGAKRSRKRAPKRARAGASWLEAVATTFVGEPAEPASTVLFELEGNDRMLEVAAEMIRLGCDRQRFRPGEVPLLMVDAPPYYTLLRALDRESGARAFVPVGQPRVWIELGFRHPLAEHITAPEDALVLVAADGWRVVEEGVFEAIDQIIDVRLPGSVQALAQRELGVRLEIPLRLSRTGVTRPPALWVVRTDALAQVERMMADVPADVVDRLLFAVGALEEAEEAVVLRARAGAPPMELSLHAERYAPHPQLPSLWLPCDMMLEPPLARRHLRSVLEGEARRTMWLRAREEGSFTLEHAEDDAFSPLAELVDYVIARSAEAIEPWIRATVFDLEAVVRSDVVIAEASGPDADIAEREASPAESKKTRKKRRAKKKSAKKKEKKRTARDPLQRLEPSVEPSDDARRAAEIEAQFLASDSAADSDERMGMWLELAELYRRLGRIDDAGHAFVRVLWEREDDGEVAGAWLAAEKGAVTLEALLDKPWPTASEMRWLVARLSGDEVSGVELEPLARFVDAHQEQLDVRVRWLAQLGLSRLAGGDVLRLTRARDRALGDLRAGLSLDRDVPGFLRARATGHGDAAVARVLSSELEQLWERYRAVKRKRSAIEAPVTVSESYVRRLFAYGFARLGDRDRVALLLEAKDGADRSDPVHRTLLDMFDERVRQGLAGLSPTTPLPGELMAELNALGTFERYKVDRLREASDILEPVERLDPAPGFIRGEVDPRGDAFVDLRALDAGPELSGRIQDIVRTACSDGTAPGERARLLDGAMDFFFALPVSQATALLEELSGALEPIEAFDRALVVEEALVLAAHFGHEPLIDELATRLHALIAAVGEERAEEIASVLFGGLRTLRRVGLRDRAEALLETAAKLVEGDAPELSVARVHLAGGFAYLGARDRAETLITQGRERVAHDEIPIKERLALVRALAHAVALAPAEKRAAEVRGLAELLPTVTDSFSTNSHFCLSILHFLESLITGLVPPERGRDGPAAIFLDEDEHLVRRRIHRDLRKLLEEAG